MRKSRSAESQIVNTLKQVEGGRSVKEVCLLQLQCHYGAPEKIN